MKKLILYVVIVLITPLAFGKTFELKKRDSKKIYKSLVNFKWANNVEVCSEGVCSVEVKEGVCVRLPFDGSEVENTMCEWSYVNDRIYGGAEEAKTLYYQLKKRHTDTVRNEIGSIFYGFNYVYCEKYKKSFSYKYRCSIDIDDKYVK